MMNLSFPLKAIIPTSGTGLWSNEAKDVEVLEAAVRLFRLGMDEFGELRVYFAKSSWDVEEDGLIYTDPGWLKGIRNLLLYHGFSDEAVQSVEYSEQGMQGSGYVSMDVGTRFLDELKTRADVFLDSY